MLFLPFLFVSSIIDADTMPVGTAIIVYPNSMTMAERNLPKSVTGVMSPYPTVVNVTTAQYMLVGMSLK